MVHKLSTIPRWGKSLLIILADLLALVAAWWLGLSLRLGILYPLIDLPFQLMMFAALMYLSLCFAVKSHNTIYRYVTLSSQQRLIWLCIIYGAIISVVTIAVPDTGIPRTAGMLQSIIFFGLLAFIRVVVAYVLRLSTLPTDRTKARVLLYSKNIDFYFLGARLAQMNDSVVTHFICENQLFIGRFLDNLVVSGPTSFTEILQSGRIDLLIIDARALNGVTIDDIERLASIENVQTSLFDGYGLSSTRKDFDTRHGLRNRDLLGRQQIPPDRKLMMQSVADKVVLITGAGGSIGSEICQQLLLGSPLKIVLLDHSEIALYSINNQLNETINYRKLTVKVIPVLGSVVDKGLINNLFKLYRPQVVFHAAAYKHVALLERNGAVAAKINVIGTYNCVTSACEFGAENFILVSSDKAVNPTNLMGATKRIAELIVLNYQAKYHPRTKISIVRFGNVLGSSGSVVPKFLKQIAEGGPVTVTHPDVERYFMTVIEAAQLVIQATPLSKGGEIFVLDMGTPIKIVDLAKQLIKLTGETQTSLESEVTKPVIQFTGLAEGEKLYEELFIGDRVEKTLHPKIRVSCESFESWGDIQAVLDDINGLCAADLTNNQIKKTIKKIVSSYSPAVE